MSSTKKIRLRLAPRFRNLLIQMICVSLIIGAIFGFIIGRADATSQTEAKEPITNEPTATILYDTPITIPTPTPTKVYYDCPLSNELQDYIRTLCEESDISFPLVIAQIQVESEFRADAVSETNDYGLMQINKINHDWLREEYGITDFLDPYQNVRCGIGILESNYLLYWDMDKALMAYNLGDSGARELWDEGIYSTEYTRKIRSAMESLQIKED